MLSISCPIKEMKHLKRQIRFVRNRKGFSLMEMMVTLLILVLLVMGMDSGLRAAIRVYDEAVFYSDSRTLAGMLDTTLSDLFRFSEQIKPVSSVSSEDLYDSMGQKIDYVFTNAEYGMNDAYIEWYADIAPNLQLKNLKNSNFYSLLNSGAFPGMSISSFSYSYNPDEAMYTVHYVISSKNGSMSYDAGQRHIPVMNPD